MDNIKDQFNFYNDKISSFVSNNKVLIATLGGIAAGIGIATVLGNNSTKASLNKLGAQASRWASQVKEGWNNENFSEILKNVSGINRREVTTES